MSLQAVARRYAVALADVVTSQDASQDIREELSAWASLMEANPQLTDVFRHPAIPYEQKRRLLLELIKRSRVSYTTTNFLQVLLQNHRLSDLSEINRQLVQELDRRAGVVNAQVTTARTISPEAQEALRAQLAQLTGSRVRLEFSVDDDLIGGVVTRIGSTLYDGSVRGQLQQIRQKMTGGY